MLLGRQDFVFVGESKVIDIDWPAISIEDADRDLFVRVFVDAVFLNLDTGLAEDVCLEEDCLSASLCSDGTTERAFEVVDVSKVS